MNYKKKLLLIFGLITLVKIILNIFIKSPSEFADAYFYTLSAKSLINLDFAGLFSSYPPLYPLAISWAYLFSDSQISYLLIKVTNSVLSSLVIFPAYLLAKEYLKDEKISLYCAIIISLLPSNFTYSAFILSENIFNFLFLTAIYFIYITMKKGKWEFIVLSSVLIALCYTTRIFGLVLFPVVIFFALSEKKYKEGFMIILLALIILTPYLFIKESLVGGYGNPIERVSEDGRVKIFDIIYWGILYTSLIYLEGLLLFTNSAIKNIIKKIKENAIVRLFVLAILSFGVFAMYHAVTSVTNYLPENDLFSIGGRPMGRYIFSIIPLIIILGFKEFKNYKINYMWSIPFSALMLYPLFPPNNINSTWLGLFSIFTNNQIIFIQITINLIISLFVIFMFNKLKKFITLKHIIFILLILNLIIFAGISYNANSYYFNRDDAKAGIYLNKLAPDSTIVIYKEECEEKWSKESNVLCDKDNGMSLIGFWNKKVIIGDFKDGDYLVSKKELNLKKIKQFGEVNIYEI